MAFEDNAIVSDGLEQLYADEALLELPHKTQIINQGIKTNLPKGKGSVLNWRTLTGVSVRSAITDGTLITPSTATLSSKTATAYEYGGAFLTTSKLVNHQYSEAARDLTTVCTDEAALSLERAARTVFLAGGGNGVYATGSSVGSIGTSNTMTEDIIINAWGAMFQYRGKPYSDGMVHFLASPKQFKDLLANKLSNTAKYTAQGMDGLSTKFIDVAGIARVYVHDDVYSAGDGESSTTVYRAMGFCDKAFGVASMENSNFHIIVKPNDAGGYSNPVNQFGSVGWKSDGFGTSVLYPTATSIIYTA